MSLIYLSRWKFSLALVADETFSTIAREHCSGDIELMYTGRTNRDFFDPTTDIDALSILTFSEGAPCPDIYTVRIHGLLPKIRR